MQDSLSASWAAVWESDPCLHGPGSCASHSTWSRQREGAHKALVIYGDPCLARPGYRVVDRLQQDKGIFFKEGSL